MKTWSIILASVYAMMVWGALGDTVGSGDTTISPMQAVFLAADHLVPHLDTAMLLARLLASGQLFIRRDPRPFFG